MNATPKIADTLPVIHRASDMTPGMARYWNAQALRLAGRVDLVDPWRTDLRDLRVDYARGIKVYRASTGGRWGKSAEIRAL